VRILRQKSATDLFLVNHVAVGYGVFRYSWLKDQQGREPMTKIMPCLWFDDRIDQAIEY
jgi:hypothetical protein